MRTTSPAVRLCRTFHICLARNEKAPFRTPPPPPYTHVVGPEFHLSQYQATEGETLVVRLSAPILTRPQIPAFTGSIEVDITAEDLPSGDPWQNARFGKCHPSVVHLLL